MSPPPAVCVKCGHFKQDALRACPSCSFAPSSPEDMARSLILSPAFDAGETVIGSSSHELAAAATQIRAGAPYHFDPIELARVVTMHQSARSITPSRLLVDGLRWLLAPAAILIALAWLVWRK